MSFQHTKEPKAGMARSGFAWTGNVLRHLQLDGDIWRPGLLAEVYTGKRTPKLAMSLVGSAINQAGRERQLPM